MPDIFIINLNFVGHTLNFHLKMQPFCLLFSWVKRNLGKFDYDGPSHLSFDEDHYCRILS